LYCKDNRIQTKNLRSAWIVRRIADPSARGRVTRVVGQLDEAVRKIRTSIFDLHTAHESDLGSLRRRMPDVVAETSAGTGISPSVRISGAVDSLVPETLAEHALAALREGISNAVRHARATAITSPWRSAATWSFDVADDGVGIAGRRAQRAAQPWSAGPRPAGAAAWVTSRPAGGTRLTWRARFNRGVVARTRRVAKVGHCG
jgi:signal transduction histidine kinase